MLALAQSILTKNVNILKAPSKKLGVLPLLLDSMSKFDLELPTGKLVIGKDITDTIGLLYFDREDSLSAENSPK